MGTTVADLGPKLSSEEFTEWLAYYRSEPSTYHLLRALLEVNVALLNAWRNKRVQVEDFLPQVPSHSARQSPRQQVAAITAAFGPMTIRHRTTANA